MNIKQFTSMGKAVDDSIKFVISANELEEYRIISEYDPENPYHVTAYGNWKVKQFIPVAQDQLEIIIDTAITIIKEN